jgi:ATP-dependent helicase/nuclease subunit B
LAPALVAAWGAAPGVAESQLRGQVGLVSLKARADRVVMDAGGVRIMDFKTGTPPTWNEVALGRKPQLALEGFLATQAGTAVADLEVWHLRGYGPTPLKISRLSSSKTPLATVLDNATVGLENLAATFGPNGSAHPAVPGKQCTACRLHSSCRVRVWGAANEDTEAAA